MSSKVLTFDVTLHPMTCVSCGIHFAVPQDWLETRRRNHQDFRCPNGDILSYPQESQLEAAQRQLREAQAQVNEQKHLRLVMERQLDKANEDKKRIEARINVGVCPCCNRTFTNVARHMKTKHSGHIEGNPQKLITGGQVN